jgi:hypothetical protein
MRPQNHTPHLAILIAIAVALSSGISSASTFLVNSLSSAANEKLASIPVGHSLALQFTTTSSEYVVTDFGTVMTKATGTNTPSGNYTLQILADAGDTPDITSFATQNFNGNTLLLSGDFSSPYFANVSSNVTLTPSTKY